MVELYIVVEAGPLCESLVGLLGLETIAGVMVERLGVGMVFEVESGVWH